MNDIWKNFIFLRILNQIEQDNADGKDGINRFGATICDKECIYFEQVFYILFSNGVFISAINHSLVYILITF